MRGLPLVVFVALSIGCSRGPAAVAPAAVTKAPPPNSVPPESKPEPAPVELSPDAVPEDLGDGFVVQLQCAPEFCDGAPWLAVEFSNPQPNTLVLEVPGQPENGRAWTAADLAGSWGTQSFFSQAGSVDFCEPTDGQACWAGAPTLVASGAAESFEISSPTVRALELDLFAHVSWRQSATPSAGDAQKVRKGWQVVARPQGPRSEGCVPMACVITPTGVEYPEDKPLPPAPRDFHPSRSLEVRDDGSCWVVWERGGCHGSGQKKVCSSAKKPARVQCP